MANSYVFRKIDGALWQQARGAATMDGLKFLDVVQQLLRNWLLQRTVDAASTAQPKTRKLKKETK